MEELFQTLRESSSARSWSRGVELARQRAVILRRKDTQEVVCQVVVPGQAISPTVTLWPEDEEWSCDCKGAEDPCSHVAAATIALKRGLLAPAEEKSANAPTQPGRVGYRFTRVGRAGQERSLLALQRVEIIGNEERPLNHAIFGGQGETQRNRIALGRGDAAVEIALGRPAPSGALGETTLRHVLAALVDCAEVQLDGAAVAVGPPRSSWRLRISDARLGFVLQLERAPEVEELFGAGALRVGKTLHAAEPLPSQLGFRPELLATESSLQRTVDENEAAHVVGEILPSLQTSLPLIVDARRLPQTRREPPHVRLELSAAGDGVTALASVVYGMPPVAYVVDGRLTVVPGMQTVPLRDEDEEQRLSKRLTRDLELWPGRRQRLSAEAGLALAQRARAIHALEIADDADRRLFLQTPLSVELDLTTTRADLRFRAAEDNLASGAVEATRVLAAWEDGSSLVPLGDGRFAPLPSDWLERYGHRVADLLATRGESATDEAPRAALLDAAALAEELDQPVPLELRNLRDRLERVEALDGSATLPEPLKQVLRSYQRAGVGWLCLLRDAGIGALLADDMGLGKTLQVICAIGARTLVVAPTSVVRSWQSEIARFRPELTVSVYHGAQRQLDADAAVTITSYAVARLDAAELAQTHWDTVVLDEAQTIRNAESQTARAVFDLNAQWRVALSGTPIENRLEDLWSIFHFLNRGLLGGRRDFVERYARPIADGSLEHAQRLRTRIRPLILRRRKTEVARELPPRSEVVVYCELSEEERRVYQAVQAATREEVLRTLQLGGGVLSALTALMRLRQAACHSALIPGQGAVTSSSKLDELRELLDEIVAEGHKALVFSQWTSLLDLVEPMLQAMDIPFARLDGSTSDRRAVIDRFQQADGPPVMLLSLKAGGVGLTLTEADHVVLLDPWWNPAAEDQAADRAHRIGQQRPVLISRLVAADTIEERILALQARKRAIANAALDDGELSSAGLSRDDLLELLG